MSIIHLWQLKTVVYLHWCLTCTVLLFDFQNMIEPVDESYFEKEDNDDQEDPSGVKGKFHRYLLWYSIDI